MNDLQTKLAVFVGALATLALVYFAYKGQGGGQQTPFITSVARVANPDAVAVAELQATRDIAEMQTQSENFATLLGYQLGLAENRTREVLGFDTNRTNLQLGQYQVQISNHQRETEMHQATQLRLAQEATARYQYESTRQTQRTERHRSVWGTIGSVAGSILRLF